MLATWLTISCALMAFLMSTHMGVFKVSTLSNGFATKSGDKKLFLHFLYAGCGCSRNIANRISQMTENKNEIHQVYWIEDDKNTSPKFPRFIQFHSLSETDPRLSNIHGAPQLHVYQNNKSLYQGGYTNTKATFLTNWVVDEIRQDRIPASAPIKGCYIPKNQNTFIANLWKKII